MLDVVLSLVDSALGVPVAVLAYEADVPSVDLSRVDFVCSVLIDVAEATDKVVVVDASLVICDEVLVAFPVPKQY